MPATTTTKKTNVSTHPTYKVMIKEAIVSLKDRTGSSQQALRKFIGAKYALPAGWEKKLRLYLKKMTVDGSLVQVKSSWKLGEALKKAPKKAPATEKTKPVKKTSTKKPVKKTTTTKTKPSVKKKAKTQIKKSTTSKKKSTTTKKKPSVKKAKTRTPGASKKTSTKTKK